MKPNLSTQELSSSTSADSASNSSSFSCGAEVATCSSQSIDAPSSPNQTDIFFNPLPPLPNAPNSLTPRLQLKSKFRNAAMAIPWRKSIKRSKNLTNQTKGELQTIKKPEANTAKNAISGVEDKDIKNIKLASSTHIVTQADSLLDAQLDLSNNSTTISSSIVKCERRDSGVGGGSLRRNIRFFHSLIFFHIYYIKFLTLSLI